VEILVVLAIIALLLTIATPRYFGSLNKSKDIALQENLRVIRVTLDKFRADKGRFPKTLEELVEHKYLRSVPIDPIVESDKAWRLIIVEDSDAEGIADVKSTANGQGYDGKRYDSY
jgi:type II secretory pathway pseudopilin PulG